LAGNSDEISCATLDARRGKPMAPWIAQFFDAGMQAAAAAFQPRETAS